MIHLKSKLTEIVTVSSIAILISHYLINEYHPTLVRYSFILFVSFDYTLRPLSDHLPWTAIEAANHPGLGFDKGNKALRRAKLA